MKDKLTDFLCLILLLSIVAGIASFIVIIWIPGWIGLKMLLTSIIVCMGSALFMPTHRNDNAYDDETEE